MSVTVHPCLCGFTCDTYPKMRYHRRGCEVWQNRPDPKELARLRRATHRQPEAKGRCEHCGRRARRHAEGCPDSLEEKTRRELLKRHGINPRLWAAFLEALRKRYEPDKQ